MFPCDLLGVGKLILRNVAGSHCYAQNGKSKYRMIVSAGWYANICAAQIGDVFVYHFPSCMMKSVCRILDNSANNFFVMA